VAAGALEAMSAEWVVSFACPEGHAEAVIVRAETREEALCVRDGLGCAATEARPLGEVVLRREPFCKDGQLRCEVETSGR
jgi:hypothetical protein